MLKNATLDKSVLEVYRKPQAEQIMDLFGVNYDLEFISLSDIDISDAAQARKSIASGAVDPVRVAEYVERARAKEIPPPIIVKTYTDSQGNVRYKVVDGNHRHMMYIELGTPTIAAYVTQLLTPDLELIVAVKANIQGWSLDETERKSAAVAFVRDGHTATKAASLTGLSAAKVEGAVEVESFWTRSLLLGLDSEILKSEFFETNDSRKRALATKVPLDQPFVSAVTLSYDANLTGEEVIALVKGLKDHRSETEQIAYLDTKREEWAARIDTNADPVDRVAVQNLTSLARSFAVLTKRTAAAYVPNSRTDADDTFITNIIEFREFLADILTSFDARP